MSEGADEDCPPSPLLTFPVSEALLAARDAGTSSLACSLDLGLSSTLVEIEPLTWNWNRQRFPYLAGCKDRSVYRWTGASFEPISRYGNSLTKLVPTPWGPPTFEIDGIKMLPTARVSPYDDAMHKVALIDPRGKVILDTCGGLGISPHGACEVARRACIRSKVARTCSGCEGIIPGRPIVPGRTSSAAR